MSTHATDQATEPDEAQDAAQAGETSPEVSEPDQDVEDAREATEAAESDEETFSREYVQELRDEAAHHRVKSKDRDDLAGRLHTALVAATGRLADPTDLAFDEEHLADNDAMSAAIDDLLERKPHLAARTVRGDVGQGATDSTGAVDLAGMLRSRA